MALLSMRQIFLAIFVFGIAFGTVSADCNLSYMEACLKSLTPAKSIGEYCDSRNKIFTCLNDTIQSCPQETQIVIKKVLKRDGVPYDRSLFNQCCNIAKQATSVCFNKTVNQQTFRQQCRNTENSWKCTRPYSKKFATFCKNSRVAKLIKAGEDNLINHLDTCSKNGYKVTVDYPGGAGNIAWSPLMTLVALATAVFKGFQGR